MPTTPADTEPGSYGLHRPTMSDAREAMHRVHGHTGRSAWQRLLQAAKVVAEWGKAPSAEEVSARDDARMLDHPALTMPLEDMAPARALLERVGAQQVAAAFVQLWREGRPPPEELTDTALPPEAGPRPARVFGEAAWFALSVGHAGRAEARWLLPKICEAGGITREAIGAIRVRESETFVQIAAADAGRFSEVTELEPGLSMRRLPGEPMLDSAPGARPRPRSGGKPAGTPAGGRKAAPAGSAPQGERAEQPVAGKKPRWTADAKAARRTGPGARGEGKPGATGGKGPGAGGKPGPGGRKGRG